VDHSVLILGSQEILSIVLALSYGGTMTGAMPGYDLDANELWEHSLMTASAAEVAVNSDLPLNGVPSIAFTVGLLHDIGKRVIGQAVSIELHNKIRELVKQSKISRVEAEMKILGTDHAEVGSVLLHDWHLPEAIIEGVAHHHQPVWKTYPQLSVVSHLANGLAHLSGSAPESDPYAEWITEPMKHALGLTPQKMEVLLAAVGKASEKMKKLMAAMQEPVKGNP
jgi:putative nucleotidyltransferase with HDIG domain